MDYSEEEDYYTQGFEKEGTVSVWVGLSPLSEPDCEVDVLQHFCGVGYYDLSRQENNISEGSTLSIFTLLSELSYSESFTDKVASAAQKKGLSDLFWTLAQYDFAYDPSVVRRPVASNPLFLGSFPYSKDHNS